MNNKYFLILNILTLHLIIRCGSVKVSDEQKKRTKSQGAQKMDNIQDTCQASKQTLMVKYKYGQRRYTGFGGSAQQVEQVLALIQDELRNRCGEYRWSLEGHTGNYIIMATYHKGKKSDVFYESSGTTPGQALRNFGSARQILQDLYEGRWQ
jgi:hypothetical protein